MSTDVPFITNQEIARVLFQTASMLEMMEGNPFRVRAYRRAALGVLFLPRQLSDYFGSDEAAPLPGIGERMRKRLGELINTGHMGVHDALLEEIGEPMLSLLAVEGIGPKRAIRLISGLQVDSINELAEAARSGRVRTLPGFGPRSEARILRAAETILDQAA